jgi:hypothetical protein
MPYHNLDHVAEITRALLETSGQAEGARVLTVKHGVEVLNIEWWPSDFNDYLALEVPGAVVSVNANPASASGFSVRIACRDEDASRRVLFVEAYVMLAFFSAALFLGQCALAALRAALENPPTALAIDELFLAYNHTPGLYGAPVSNLTRHVRGFMSMGDL